MPTLRKTKSIRSWVIYSVGDKNQRKMIIVAFETEFILSRFYTTKLRNVIKIMFKNETENQSHTENLPLIYLF